MANVDATTPHMKIEKAWTDAHTSRNLDAIRPILSNNFVVKIFPKADGHPDLTKEEYIQRYSAAFALFSKVEVTSHEVIEAPGKLVNRATILFTTPDGTIVDYDSLNIISFVEEGGEPKVLEAKHFSNPEQRVKFEVEAAKLMGIPAA